MLTRLCHRVSSRDTLYALPRRGTRGNIADRLLCRNRRQTLLGSPHGPHRQQAAGRTGGAPFMGHPRPGNSAISANFRLDCHSTNAAADHGCSSARPCCGGCLLTRRRVENGCGGVFGYFWSALWVLYLGEEVTDGSSVVGVSAILSANHSGDVIVPVWACADCERGDRVVYSHKAHGVLVACIATRRSLQSTRLCLPIPRPFPDTSTSTSIYRAGYKMLYWQSTSGTLIAAQAMAPRQTWSASNPPVSPR